MTAQVSPEQNALDSLKRVALDLEADLGDAMCLKSALSWGWHCVGLLAYIKLQPKRAVFDTWVQDYLHEGEPDLAKDRDARWEERQRLSFLELLDLLSYREVSILKPEFYQGWQDRTTRCHNLRDQVQGVVGAGIGTKDREKLLLLLAAYHRLIRLPAAVALDVDEVWAAYPALLELVELLAGGADGFDEVLTRCRSALMPEPAGV